MNKEKLNIELDKAFQAVIDWVNEQPIENLNKELVKGKWPISHHIYHLVKSTRAANKGMKSPKMMLKLTFGTTNRKERSYDELVEKYQTTLSEKQIKAPENFSAEAGRTFDKNELIEKFLKTKTEMKKALEKWDEIKLSKYVLPHPAIGKCTVREIVYFTTYHTYHHLNILKNEYHFPS